MDRKKRIELFGLGASLIILYFVLLNAGTILSFADDLWVILTPFLLGGALAFVLNVPMRVLETRVLCMLDKTPVGKKLKRPLSMLLVLALAILLIYLVMSMVIPEMIATIQTILSAIPGAVRRLDQLLEPTEISLSQLLNSTFAFALPSSDQLTAQLENMMRIALKGVAFSGSVIGSVYTNVLDMFFVLMFIIYFLSGKERLAAQLCNVLKAYLKPHKVEKILNVASLTQKTFSAFITGQCLEAVILGGMCFLAMTIFKMPYVLLISIFIGVTALIPVVGGWIGCIVGVVLILVADPMKAVGFVIMFLVIQQLEGNIVYPRVMGNAIGLPSLWVLFAVVVGEGLMGVLGMLLFIPLTSVAYKLLRDNVNRRLREQKELHDEETA